MHPGAVTLFTYILCKGREWEMKYFTLISAEPLGCSKNNGLGNRIKFFHHNFSHFSCCTLSVCSWPWQDDPTPGQAFRRWLGHFRLAVLLWKYQNLAQRCCFVQSPGRLLAGTRACSQLWWGWETSFLYCKGTLCPPGSGSRAKTGEFSFSVSQEEKQ